MLLEARRQAVGVRNRLLRRKDDAFAGLRAHVRKVAEDAHAVHLGDHLNAEFGQPAVVLFIAPAAHEILRVVGDLHDADAQVLEHLQEADLVLDARKVLPAKEDSGASLFFRPVDVGGGEDLRNEIRVVPEVALPARQVFHAAAEIFPD